MAVLLGILMIVSGVFHLIRAFTRSESRRVWPGIANATSDDASHSSSFARPRCR
ncbi:MAG: hypothetical protein ACRDNW_26110 [Trebonia sp.]